MGIFDKAKKAAMNVGSSVSQSAANVGSSVGVAAQDNSELNALKMQINVINQELDAAYVQIGKKYVDNVIATGDTGNLNVADLLNMMEPKLDRKAELEAQLIEVEKRIKSNAVLRDKQRAEQEFQEEKLKLDRALAMDVISQEEYDAKISVAQKKVDNFEAIRKVENQFEMGIITREEKDSKIAALTQ